METRSNHVLVGAVVLILLVVLALFAVWLARIGTGNAREYDIFFKQSVDGLNQGLAGDLLRRALGPGQGHRVLEARSQPGARPHQREG
jgi:hypothetical protein